MHTPNTASRLVTLVLTMSSLLLIPELTSAEGTIVLGKKNDSLRQRLNYQAEAKRLAENYSLERVARERIEVGWENLLGMATPLSFRVPIQACHHPDLVFVQPDMSISLGVLPESLGIGFALGGHEPKAGPPQLPDFMKVKQRLRHDYQPIVESQWVSGPLKVTQTAFAILPNDLAVVSGKETQFVVIRITVKNESTTPRKASLYLLVGKMGGTQNANYGPFLGPISRWQTPPLGIVAEHQTLRLGGRVLLVYRCSLPIKPRFLATLEGHSENNVSATKLTNCLQFPLSLGPGETQTVDFIAAGSSRLCPPEEVAQMVESHFEAACQRAAQAWDRGLLSAMEYVTPEPRLNALYKQLILSSLGHLLQTPDRPWHEPLQTPISGVWAWEFAHMAVPMMAIGYCRDLEPSLRYFIERQNGVGRWSANTRSPGEVKSTRGSYVGDMARWMNETGSILWTMASRYHYSRDVEWLTANRPSILAAWDWIQAARARTRITDSHGKKAASYGLLPSGRPVDIWEQCYQFTFSDNFTWFGMAEMAAALRHAGLPEADRLTKEADEYRQCILDVIQREQYVDPETKLPFIPNSVGYREKGPIDPYWQADGPIQLFDTALLGPKDARFDAMIEYTRRKYGLLMGLTEHIRGSEWYPNQTERAYYKCFLARGEIEKSLLVFYSNLVYGRSNDTYQTVERFHTDNPNHSPLQPNASGNGRMLDMMRRMMIDEQDPDTIWLLRGCPRRWFAKGQSIVVKKARTRYGEMSLRTESDGSAVTIDIESPSWEPPKEIRLVVRHPSRKAIAKATVNGRAVTAEAETVVLRRPTGHLQVICRY